MSLDFDQRAWAMASFTQIVTSIGRGLLTLIWIGGFIVLSLMAMGTLIAGNITFVEFAPICLLALATFKVYLHSRKSSDLRKRDKVLGVLVILFIFSLFVGVLITNKNPHSCANSNAPPDSVIEGCTKIIQSDRSPKADKVNALSDRGAAYAKKGQTDLAIKDYDNAIELDPNSLPAFTNRGVARTNLKQYDLAIQDFSEALRVDPHHSIVLNDRGNAYRATEKYDLALKDLDEAIQNNPTFAAAISNRATVYLLQSKYDQALQDVEDALRLDPSNAKMLALRGLINHQMRKYDQAIQDYNSALSMSANDTAVRSFILVARGFSYLDESQYDKAGKDFDQSIQVDPESGVGYLGRSGMFISQEQYGKSIGDLDQAIHYDATHAGPFFNRGLAKLYAGAPGEAADDFTASIRLEPAIEHKIPSIIMLHIARNRAGQNDQQEFERNSAQISSDKWPMPILDLYRGAATVDDVSMKAKIGDATARREQSCDVDFYVGEFYWLTGHKDKAKPLFQAADTDCAIDDFGHPTARTELKTIGN